MSLDLVLISILLLRSTNGEAPPGETVAIVPELDTTNTGFSVDQYSAVEIDKWGGTAWRNSGNSSRIGYNQHRSLQCQFSLLQLPTHNRLHNPGGQPLPLHPSLQRQLHLPPRHPRFNVLLHLSSVNGLVGGPSFARLRRPATRLACRANVGGPSVGRNDWRLGSPAAVGRQCGSTVARCVPVARRRCLPVGRNRHLRGSRIQLRQPQSGRHQTAVVNCVARL
ncbi:hypothetical protein LSTR_LSTR005773 [Laodelphax striatellus]|uniref:Secreted protein n=1 Tax=Laodelphax striatellus TaxID=195883 RepID=A0A482X024_LAOST|nr:hypothetical protein LSTR_LSTR005773 [Laodelphax striatellus]